MRNKLLLTSLLLLVTLLLVSCGSTDKTPAETIDPLGNSVRTEAPKTETTKPEETKAPEKEPPKPEDYDYFKVFEAPKGNPRDIVYDYMYSMSQVKWVAAESWNTTWKNQGDFKVNLSYEKGKTYYGIPYSDTRATLDEFLQFLPQNERFTPNSPWYEELLGNHCSSSMVVSYQQILDFPYGHAIAPVTQRKDVLFFPAGVEVPPARSDNPDDWISETVFAHNGQDKIYEAYAALDKGDILYKKIDGSGHTRMVSKVEVFKSAAGKLMPGRSYVYCLEQTNAWADNKKESTWFVDRKYSFKDLYDTFFMPVTFYIFHEENPVIKDAYVTMKGKNTPETIKKMLNGAIETTFPLTYVRTTVTNNMGKVVEQALEYRTGITYKYNVRNMTYKLNIDKLPAGEYTFSLRVGIARGSVEFENFKFTVE